MTTTAVPESTLADFANMSAALTGFQAGFLRPFLDPVNLSGLYYSFAVSQVGQQAMEPARVPPVVVHQRGVEPGGGVVAYEEPDGGGPPRRVLNVKAVPLEDPARPSGALVVVEAGGRAASPRVDARHEGALRERLPPLVGHPAQVDALHEVHREDALGSQRIDRLRKNDVLELLEVGLENLRQRREVVRVAGVAQHGPEREQELRTGTAWVTSLA